MELQQKQNMTQLPSLNRRNSQKKRPLGLNDRISLKIKAKLCPLDEQSPTTDTDIKGTFHDLDEKYAKQKKKRTELQSLQYYSNGTLKLTPPSSSEGTKQNATIHNIERKVKFLLEKHSDINEFICTHQMNRDYVLQQVTQPFFMLHLLQGLRSEEELHALLLKKIQLIDKLQKSKSNYQTSENKVERLLRDRMKLLQKRLQR